MPDTVHSSLPLWACLASLLAVPAIVLFRREPVLREATTFVSGFLKLGIVLLMLPIVLDGHIIEYTLLEGLGVVNAPIRFRVDGLGMLFALVASSLWIVTSLFSVGYMGALREHSQTRFYAFFALSLCATLGVAFAGNLLTLYLFYEMLSLSTWPLVTHHQDREARSGGRTYLTYLLGTSICFALPALIYTWVKTGGDVEFGKEAILAQTELGAMPALILLLAFVFGFSKAGLMPFHSWLPGAMVAPTPVSALLHAVAVVKVGVFCVLRVVTGVFGVDLMARFDLGTVLGWIAAFTIVVSSWIALSQDNLKRRLAFSTIGQLAYIVLGAAILKKVAVQGAMLHIATHAVGKITLFLCAGAIFAATGKKYLSEMRGIGRRMPVTMGAFFIGAISVIGLPPTAGFVSKWYLLAGLTDRWDRGAGPQRGVEWLILTVLIFSALLNVAYLMPPVWRAFFEGETSEPVIVKEAPPACVIPLVITSMLCLALFFWPDILIQLTTIR